MTCDRSVYGSVTPRREVEMARSYLVLLRFAPVVVAFPPAPPPPPAGPPLGRRAAHGGRKGPQGPRVSGPTGNIPPQEKKCHPVLGNNRAGALPSPAVGPRTVFRHGGSHRLQESRDERHRAWRR